MFHLRFQLNRIRFTISVDTGSTAAAATVHGTGLTCDIRAAGRIHSNAVRYVYTGASKIGRIQHTRAVRRNLGHEGVHSSFSNRSWINSMLSYSFDLIGSSGYLWKMRHVYSHHPYPMVPKHDVDIQQSEMLTFVPMENPKPGFKHQHIYVPFLYCAYTLNAIFRRDWEDFFSNRIGDKVVKPDRRCLGRSHKLDNHK